MGFIKSGCGFLGVDGVYFGVDGVLMNKSIYSSRNSHSLGTLSGGGRPSRGRMGAKVIEKVNPQVAKKMETDFSMV